MSALYAVLAVIMAGLGCTVCSVMLLAERNTYPDFGERSLVARYIVAFCFAFSLFLFYLSLLYA